ncbi:MAG: TraB/GumN family protein [Firmicutes bacterium]|nr:TraB/GumN family protein [Bacillota bacterium]MCM1401803.1 TraB/GumN family protein [Bacteroides sp.]MCM1477684.1 TraB/GumN family protein [Bacteroides sp.]
MKRTLSLLLLSLAMALTANAQLLWKITGNGVTKPSYLFGTHHVAPLSVLESTPGFSNALNTVDKVYGEIDMQALSNPATQLEMAQYSMAPADSTLSKVILATTLARIDSLFQASGLPFTTAMLEPMKPATVDNIVTLIFAQKVFPDFDPNSQLDLTIQKMARDAGKQVEGLEGVDTQLKALYGAPISEQAESLISSLDNPVKAIEMARLMSEAYMAGDIAKLAEIIENPENGLTPEEASRLLTDRNNAWIDILLGVIPTASVMAVVGAGHLTGSEGLINRLREAGYTVEPVK